MNIFKGSLTWRFADLSIEGRCSYTNRYRGSLDDAKKNFKCQQMLTLQVLRGRIFAIINHPGHKGSENGARIIVMTYPDSCGMRW